MAVKSYKGALTVKDINKEVVTPLDKYLPYKCPIGHNSYQDTCASCRTLYGHHRRSYNASK
tara:strand:- start:4529 stop:4711 length:183 start_codon:yes stop_codon:yes gene_type:complete